MATKKKSDPFVRCFDVSDPTRHPKGHTIYKVTQKSIRVDAPDEDVLEVVVWRRYNDFKKLYKAMITLHRALHRKESFPPFAASKVFGRYEDSVIAERRGSAQDLLNFVGQRHYLVNSKPFQAFFEGGEIVAVNPTSDPILQPVRPDDGDDDSETTSMTSDVTDVSLPIIDLTMATPDQGSGVPEPSEEGLHRVESNVELGGVWQFRQAEDDISLDDDLNDDETGSDLSEQPGILAADIGMFDQLAAPAPEAAGSEDSKSLEGDEGEPEGHWLVTAMSQLEEQGGGLSKKASTASLRRLEAELPLPPTESPSAETPTGTDALLPGGEPAEVKDTQQDLVDIVEAVTPTQETVDMTPEPSSHTSIVEEFDPLMKSPKVECGRGDQDFSLLTPPAAPGSSVMPVAPSPASSGSVGGEGEGSEESSSAKPSPKRYVTVDLRDKGSYILKAAKQISLAQQCEANGNYHMAFTYYRNGVGILLSGVQGDENKTRREVVRRKTGRYLIKAEDIYNQYMAQEANNDQRWDPGQRSPSRGLDPTAALLQGPASELKNLRVLGIIDKVMLVYDGNTENTCVLKVLAKSSSAERCRTIVPSACPYMVCLLRFYETPHALFLLLRHASGGKLWHYISGYLSQQVGTTGLEHWDDRHEKNLRSPHVQSGQDNNVYTGQHLMQNKNVALSNTKQQTKTASKETRTTDRPDSLVKQSPGTQSSHSRSSQDPDLYATPECASSYADLFSRDNASHNSDNVSHNVASHISADVISSEHNGDMDNDDVSQDIDIIAASRRISFDASRTASSSSLPQGEPLKTGFQDLLDRSKPGIESFSINSYDSDSGTASRFNSTASDHIESIPEVTEMSPTHTTDVFEAPGLVDSVIASQPILNHNADHAGMDASSTAPLNGVQAGVSELEASVEQLLAEADQEVLQITTMSGQPVISLAEDGTPADEPTTGQESLHITAETRSRGSIEEQSIYDLHPHEPSDNESPNWSLRTPSPAAMDPPAEDQVYSTPATQPGNEQYDAARPRFRTLSSAFGDLNLTGLEESDKDGAVWPAVYLPEGCVRQWAAEIVLALFRLHELKLICRDLHPANVLLGERGHVLLTYISQWKGVERGISRQAQEGLYTAPELNGLKAISPSCDWWSLGVLLFELLTGRTLQSCYPCGVTTHTVLEFPAHVSSEAEALLSELLRWNPQERLGSGINGQEDLMQHPFFSGIDWQALQQAGS